LFVNQISRESLNGFAQHRQGRRTVCSLAVTTLNVKVKGQGHPGQKRAVDSHHPPAPNGTRSLQITSYSSRRDRSVAAGGWLRAACVRFVFGKTSLALVSPFFVVAVNVRADNGWHFVTLDPHGTFRFQAGPSPTHQCVAATTKRLEETSRAPAYHLAEGDWCRCTVGKHRYPLSLEEGQRSCSLATYHRHGNTPL